jgi:HPt (histidine-containing phosphotransfer) domain-containing protein
MNTDPSDGPTDPAEPPALNLMVLARLHELDPDGRNGVVRRVLTAYAESLRQMHSQLQSPSASGDVQSVTRIAHTLKSSSASVGALALAAACAELEKIMRSGTPDEIAGGITRLLNEARAALAAVEAMLRA